MNLCWVIVLLMTSAFLLPVLTSAEGASSIPRGAEIRSVSVQRVSEGYAAPDLNALRRLLTNARRLPSAAVIGPAATPWCAGELVTARGAYRFILLTSGEGDLVLPGGSHLRFRFDRSLIQRRGR